MPLTAHQAIDAWNDLTNWTTRHQTMSDRTFVIRQNSIDALWLVTESIEIDGQQYIRTRDEWRTWWLNDNVTSQDWIRDLHAIAKVCFNGMHDRVHEATERMGVEV